jgi:hypothetical protein
MSSAPTKGELALAYARKGWKVFPIVPGTKDRPLVKWGAEASCDQAIVTQWWKRVPDANIGLAVGQSGLAIVDLDNKKGKNGSKTWDKLQMLNGDAPDTLTVRTPSGGYHLYFAGAVRNSVEKLGDGVDTRGEGGRGGYVLLPGSSLDGVGEYTVTNRGTPISALPEWVIQTIGEWKSERVHRTDIETELDTPAVMKWAEHYLAEDARPAVDGKGGNNTTFYVACSCRDKGLSEDTTARMMIELYNPRCQPPWSDDEIRTFAKNAWSYASVVGPGGDSAQAHFGSATKEDDWGKAGEPPDISMFAEFGARPMSPSGQSSPDGETTDGRSLLDDWVWIVQQKVFMRRRDKFVLDAVSFDSYYGFMGEKGKIAQTIMASKSAMRKFETVNFLPGQDEFAGSVYNTWTRPSLTPREGDTATFDEHMIRLLPNDEERDHALDWMAWVVQNETLKPNFMFLMQGEQGCGKSALGVLLARIVDERNTMFLRTEDVGNRFNSWVLRTRLAVVEELMGDDKRTLANRMKALITQETVTVEMKGKDLLVTPNKAAFMAFTNHMDALRLENSDRRYLIFKTKAKGKGTAPEYWNRLWAFIKSDVGASAVFHKLLTRKVATDWGLGRAPHTKAHDEMRVEALSDAERFLMEAYELGNEPFQCDLVSATDVEAALPERLKRMTGISKLVIAFLRDEIGAANLGPHRFGGRNSRQARLWAIRRPEMYQSASHEFRVKRYLDAQKANSYDEVTAQDEFDDVEGDPLA